MVAWTLSDVAGSSPVENRDETLPSGRLWRLGAAALTDRELLEHLVGSEALAPLSGLLGTVGPRALALEDPHELLAQPGVAPEHVCRLLAGLELGRRASQSRDRRPRLATPSEIHRYLVPILSTLRHEELHVLCLNGRNVLLRDAKVAEGTTNRCWVDPREVFAPALTCRATGIVLAHNHPSGDPEPSQADLALTRQLHAGGKLLGLGLLDHLVLGEGGYVSMLERDLLPRAA